MPSSHLILCRPLLLLAPVPPSIRIFSNESTLCMRWPKYWSCSASASVLPMDTQDWSLGWAGWISLQSKGLSRVFSNTTKASILQCSAFFLVQLSHPYMTTVVLNSLNFSFSVKCLISSLILKEIHAGQSNLGSVFFPFITSNISCHSLLACRLSSAISTVNFMGFPLYVTCCFSLAALNIFSLCLILLVWSICVLACFSLGLFCMGFSVLLGLDYFLFHDRKFLTIIFSKNFSDPLLFSFSSGTPIIQMLLQLILPQRSLQLSLSFFILFSLSCSSAVISTILSSSSLIHFSASIILLFI